jgi:L-aspartate oxidase
VVSRAIFQHLEATESDPTTATVYLDLSPLEPERLRQRFPNIIERCQGWGIDIFQEQMKIPVAPAAHYWMGGIRTDLDCRTSIPGLYAIGETSSTGVHGANRLASNSLLECIVFAAQLAHLDLPPVSRQLLPLPQMTWDSDWSSDWPVIQHLRQSLPVLMWRYAGICRTQSGLETAIAQVEQWRRIFNQLPSSQSLTTVLPGQTVQLPEKIGETHLRTWSETRNLLDVAYLILKSALFRQESRGGHYRLDYPDPLPEWQVHTLVTGDCWERGAIS